ncbi:MULTISPECIES: aminotransferase class V-fold PLP-dependent enzyme [unclassified Leptolyngbya]|uniref:trans-sulfuration enzyme family protein n=1 Tax=unclassified Leptolyngbya TaxID=2650499 RepID=UPI00168542B7|nr:MULTISPECIES: aminotransferase class V-fold PLP-dependent enzyme [unclassified Leptolyngbya]MBD1910781.1 aminotransferase class V-fold PLP-dependent enzyme [Leptolyngbya sp. FACHB-8]MBD2158857.1 aminotransferase class V-fold PLP-dependent enzyme [Leptolyngbya sp. FACHB-16]
MHIETLAIHAGRQADPTTGAIAPPLYLSTTFEQEPNRGLLYTRNNNPNRTMLEECLGALEGGEVAIAFSSGSAATASVFQALRPGDHVIAPNDAYTGTTAILRSLLQPWGLAVSFLDMTDLEAVQSAVQDNTRLIWIETPSNPMLKVVDIAAVAAIAHHANALCVCDNTWATPLLQRPFELGVDLVVHSTTKYLGGHSDVLGGAVIARVDSDTVQQIRQIQVTAGAVPSPFDCWLLLRGIQSLPYRMRGHCENAMKLATWLGQHPGVSAVHYPGLEGNAGYAIARKQMTDFGGMLSVQIRGGREQSLKLLDHLQIFQRATSLGGVESLIEHRATTEGPDTTTPDDLLRVSVGLEHPSDLIADLEQAFQKIQ